MNYNGAMNFKWKNVPLVARLKFLAYLAGAYFGLCEFVCINESDDEVPATARMNEQRKAEQNRNAGL